jgi:hypothetical protein
VATVIKELVWLVPLLVVVGGGLALVRQLLPRVWAVVRHTLAEAIRMKVAVLFFVLMLLGFWGATRTQGDGTVSGRVQSFLVYSLTSVGILLSLLSIFLSRSLSEELVHRQILMLMAKPLPRWQYLFGKWLGIVLLDAALLTLTGAGIYVTVRLYLARQTPLNVYDASRLQNEVLTARHATPFEVPRQDFDREVNRLYEWNLEEGIYDRRTELDPAKEKQLLRRYVEARWRNVPVGTYRVFEFTKVLCDRTSVPLFSVDADSGVGSELDSGVLPASLRREFVDHGDPLSEYAHVSIEDPGRSWMIADSGQAYYVADTETELAVSRGPMVQIRYKAQANRYPPDEILRTQWIAGNPEKGTKVYRQPRRDTFGRYHAIPFPADAVAEDRTLTVTCVNINPYPGEEQFDNMLVFEGDRAVEVLFEVGSFGGNLMRLLLLTQCKLMFLTAVALLFATVFSFPVACLCSLTVYVLATIRAFLDDALGFLGAEGAVGLYKTVFPWLLKGLYLLIPNFAGYSATETLADGRNVGLAWVLQGILYLVVIGTSLSGTLACVLFHRREVSEVSV